MLNTKHCLLLSILCLVSICSAAADSVATVVSTTTFTTVFFVATQTFLSTVPGGGEATFTLTKAETEVGTETVTQIRIVSRPQDTATANIGSSFDSASSPTITPGTTSSTSTNSVPAAPSNSNEPTTSSNTTTTRSKSNAGLIAGIVISSLCGLIGILIAVISLHKRRRALRQITQITTTRPAPFFASRTTSSTIPSTGTTEKSTYRGAGEESNVDPEIATVPSNTAVMIQEMVARALRRELAGMRESRVDMSRPPTYYNGSVRGV